MLILKISQNINKPILISFTNTLNSIKRIILNACPPYKYKKKKIKIKNRK